MNRAVVAAAARLGVPTSEIVGVHVEDAGVVIRTTDGQAYIDVPVDRPDPEGKTGLMFLAAPSATYGGGFPVFAQLAEDDDVDAGEPDAEADKTPARPSRARSHAKGGTAKGDDPAVTK